MPGWPRFSWATVPVFFHSCNFTGPYTDAALDVIAGEPDPPAAVTAHPRVIATPHIAFSSPDAIQELRERTVDEVLRAFRGEPARVLVTPGG